MWLIMKNYLERQRELFDKDQRQKLSQLNVMIAGAGGLGTNQAIQLQRIGINKIYLYDYDKVELSNLNRQLCYGKNDIGRFKVEAAADFLAEFELDTKIIIKKEKISLLTEVPSDIDIIFDGLDNFETRFIVDQLAKNYNIPFIHAGIEEFFAQIMLILPDSRQRLKDVFESGAKEVIPTVFSPAVTITASLQIIEALKYLLDFDDYLENQMLYFDFLNRESELIELA